MKRVYNVLYYNDKSCIMYGIMNIPALFLFTRFLHK